MPTRILVVGGGGREHALAWKLAHEPGVNAVIVAPGNPGIATEPRTRCVPGVSALDVAGLIALARSEAVELVVIGPEAPLAAGLADAFVEAGIATFGPGAGAARIETSKAFCREVAEAAGVPMARGAAFSEIGPARDFAAELARSSGVVVKADGLAAGKGVTVCDDLAAAERALEAVFAGSAEEGTAPAARVVIEERLTGREASLIAICDGSEALALPAARDHKRLLDVDAGPNTGGMGAYGPLSDLPDELAEALVAQIHVPLLAELRRRGTPFRGALYAGLMLTPDGPRLLECNARFGDPETQAILPRLGVPLGPLLLAAAQGSITGAARALGLAGRLLPATRETTVAIVLAAQGYPVSPRRGDEIAGLDEAAARGGIVFHAGTRRDADGSLRTDGGRVLAVVGRGADLAGARAAAERAVDAIGFAGAQRRHDIGLDIPAAAADRAAPRVPAGVVR